MDYKKISILFMVALLLFGCIFQNTPSDKNAMGFASIKVIGWKLTDEGVLTLTFKNNFERDVRMENITATTDDGTIVYSTPFEIKNEKQSSTINIGTFPNSQNKGSNFVVNITIIFTDLQTEFIYTDSGKVTGKVS